MAIIIAQLELVTEIVTCMKQVDASRAACSVSFISTPWTQVISDIFIKEIVVCVHTWRRTL